MIRRALMLLALAAGAVPAPARAQAASSSLEDLRQRRLLAIEQVRKDLEAAPFHLGPLRLLPSIEVRELGYDSNVFGSPDHPESDEVARVAAGFRALLPVGGNLFLVVDALPSYDYYAHHPQLREFGGVYRAGALAVLSRLSLDAHASDERSLELVSSEVLRPALRKRRQAGVTAEIEIRRRLGLVGEVSESRIRYSEKAAGPEPGFAALSELARRERVAREGVRYHPAENFHVTALAEQSDARFDLEGSLRDNRSTAYLLSVYYSRPRLYVDLTGGYRTIRPVEAGAVPEFRGSTGSFFVDGRLPARRAGIELWGHRGVDYGLFQDVPYFREDRIGGGPVFRIGTRLQLLLFGETGKNRYPAPVFEYRIVDAGAQLDFRLSSKLLLKLRGSETRYNSRFAGFGRRVVRLQSGLEFHASGFGD
jgi:hypothetical protein